MRGGVAESGAVAVWTKRRVGEGDEISSLWASMHGAVAFLLLFVRFAMGSWHNGRVEQYRKCCAVCIVVIVIVIANQRAIRVFK